MNIREYKLFFLLPVFIISILACESSAETTKVFETQVPPKKTSDTRTNPNTEITPTITASPEINLKYTPVAINDQIAVFNLNFFETNDGDLVIYGESINIGNQIIKDIKVSISLYDANGNLSDTESSYVYLPWEHNIWNTGVLHPEEQAPFKIIYEDPGEWKNTKSIIEYEIAEPDDYSEHYRNLEIQNHVGRSVDDMLFNYQITGEIRNVGNKSTGGVWIIATLYNREGMVVGVDEVLTDYDEFHPGETLPFKVEVFSRGKVDSYQLLYYSIEH